MRERYAWTGRIVKGMKDEYIRRHDALWPELKALLKSAGIENYSIFTDGETLFGYYECALGAAYAASVQAGSPVVDRWNEYMSDILIMEQDKDTGAQPRLVEVYRLE